jgi:cyclic beta-1,2-glucan synthetase
MRLEQHAESLAAAQQIAPNPKRGRPLAKRLYDNTRSPHRNLSRHRPGKFGASANHAGGRMAAGQFSHRRRADSRDQKTICRPATTASCRNWRTGRCRAIRACSVIAWALIAHTDSAFDIQKLTRFVEAYQRVQPLTIGELWALAITLRITLVENLRRLAEAIVARQSASQLADALADRILGTAKSDPEPAPTILHSLGQVPWSTAFAVELAQRLRDHDPNITPALRWLNDRLAAARTTTDQIVREEFQRQSATDVTVRSVITSMRLVSMINWAEFFESVSPVDAVLRGASDFAAMDFPTRDRYRRAIEELARESGHDEVDVTKQAIAAAKRATDQAAEKDPAPRRESDPGYYLIARGRRAFEKELGCRVPFRTRLFQLNSDLGVMSYVGMIAVVTAIILALILLAVAYVGIAGWPLLVLAIVGLRSGLGCRGRNREPRDHPAGRWEGFCPDWNCATASRRICAQSSSCRRCSPAYRRSKTDRAAGGSPSFQSGRQFYFRADLRLVRLRDRARRRRRNASRRSDRRHCAAERALRAGRNSARFFLLHRRRIWNEGEGKWIGWERKRGKLHELNRLLRGATDTTFMPIDGHARRCPPASAMSSRSTPIRACRSGPPSGWSERWRIPSTSPTSILMPAWSCTATGCFSRA